MHSSREGKSTALHAQQRAPAGSVPGERGCSSHTDTHSSSSSKPTRGPGLEELQVPPLHSAWGQGHRGAGRHLTSSVVQQGDKAEHGTTGTSPW